MGKTLSSRLIVAAGIATAFFASPAMAANQYLGVLVPNVAYSATGVIASKTNPTDSIFFSLASKNDLGTSISILPKIKVGPFTEVLKSVTADLYAVGSPTLLAHLIDGQSVTLSDLSAASYYVKVAGVAANSTVGGTYGLSLFASHAASAPGPAGLLFVGGAALMMGARRRREQKRQSKLALA